MEYREQWGSQLGFVLACIGSAVGLGNIWRFPYIVGTNGGGAFLVPYAIITVCFGLAFMILEFAVGRYYQTSVISSLMNIRKRFKWPGIIIVIISTAILSYYLVILGWVLSFLILMISGESMSFDEYVNSWYPIFSFLVVLAFTYGIIRRGISNGIERLNKIGIILLVSMIIPLAIYGIFLPGAQDGIEFYLTPDFSKLSNPDIWATAFGQVFFSLSIGSGILLTYGSYLRGKLSLVRTSSIIVVSNAMVSFVAGLMIFSFVFAFGMDPAGGTTLVFNVLPSIFETMEFGYLVGTTFFILLLIAGLTSAVSLFQVPVSSLEDSASFSKSKASGIVALTLLLFGGLAALSYSPVNLSIFETPLLDLMDTYFGTFGLSIAAIIFIVIVTWFMDKKKLLEEINLHSKIHVPAQLLTVVKFVLPALVIASIIFTMLPS